MPETSRLELPGSNRDITGDDAALLNNRELFYSTETTGLLVSNCRFEAYSKVLVHLHNVEDFRIVGTELRHSYYQLFLTGSTRGGEIFRTLFHDSEGDGIKTGYRNSSDVRDMHLDQCSFEHNGRDGIDTTGGFRDSLVERTLFLDLFAGFDLKAIYENEGDGENTANNRDITIRDCDFSDPGSGAIVVTTLDRVPLVTDANADAQLVHDVFVYDSVVEQRDRESRAMLIKDGHDIYWDGLELLGGAAESRIFGLAAPGDFGDRPLISQTNWSVEVSNVSTGPVRALPPERPFDTVGPR